MKMEEPVETEGQLQGGIWTSVCSYNNTAVHWTMARVLQGTHILRGMENMSNSDYEQFKA